MALRFRSNGRAARESSQSRDLPVRSAGKIATARRELPRESKGMGVAIPQAVPQLIGWVSSLILVATISNQVWRQWKHEGSAKSARWLFWGQLAASTGFCL